MNREIAHNFEIVEKRLARSKELVTILGREAKKATTQAGITKVLVIFLGAFVATREVANQLVGTSNAAHATIIVIYTGAGLLIAGLAGLEAAFRWDRRSAELRILAAAYLATTQKIQSQMLKDRILPTSEEKRSAVEKLLDTLDTNFGNIQEKATALGVNVAFELSEIPSTLYTPQDHVDEPENAS